MNNFTATEILAILTGLGGIIAGIGAVLVNVIVAMRTSDKIRDVAVVAQHTNDKVEAVATTAKVIEGHVNSAATAAAAKNAAYEKELIELRKLLSDQKEIAALLAQSAAAAPAPKEKQP